MYSKMLKIGFILAFVVLILGNIFLVKKLLNTHSTSVELRLNPSQYSSERSQFVETNIFIYGDSLAALWKSYPDIGSSKVLNYGIQGQTTAQLLLRADKELSNVSADWTILFAGGNDMKAVASFPERSGMIVEQAIGNIKALIREVPGKRKIIATTPPVFSLPLRYRLLDYQAGIEAQQKLNAKIRNLESENVKILDLYEIFSNKDNLHEFSDDGIHINTKGYNIVNSKVSAILVGDRSEK